MTVVHILLKQIFLMIILLYSLVTCRYMLSSHMFSCISALVTVLNFLLIRLTVLLRGLACKPCVSSSVGSANLLKSRVRHNRAGCQKCACQGHVTHTTLMDEGLSLLMGNLNFS